MIKYIRDGRAPIPKDDKTSRVMSANKAKNTGPEIMLRKTLWKVGLRGYRLHYKFIPGSPDIVYTRYNLAIFINGCFWHRCPTCKLSLPKTNKDFWRNKFKKNVQRDRRKIQNLKNTGWKVIVIWECQIKIDPMKCVKNIKKYIKQ